MVMRGCAVTTLAVLSLAACGASKEDRRAEVVTCAIYLQSLDQEGRRGNRAFLDRVIEDVVGKNATDADRQRLATQLSQMSDAAAQYQAEMEPARMSLLISEQSKLASDHVADGKDNAVAKEIRDCVANWEALGKT